MSAYQTLVAWVVSMMMTWAPPHKLYPGNETMQQAHAATYEEKARDAIAVIYTKENTTIFGGRWGRAMDLALLMKIAASEHAYIETVGGIPEIRGGRSWCLMSLNIGKGRTIEGWTGPELDASRIKCFRAGYNAMKRSFGGCRKHPFIYGLSVYNSGTCNNQDTASVNRINEASYRVNTKVPKDEEILKELFPPPVVDTTPKN